MTAKLTKRLDVSITPSLQEMIRAEAFRRHRTFPDTVRTLLKEALGKQLPPIISDNDRKEFEISLTNKEAGRLEKLGYDVSTFHAEQLELL